jgi:shikimate kinase
MSLQPGGARRTAKKAWRIHNFDARGIAKRRDQTFRALFEERQSLYRKYAEITIDCNTPDQETLAIQIADALSGLSDVKSFS